jgi:hypothetical protein
VRLVGLDAGSLSVAQEERLGVTLHWIADTRPNDDLLIGLRLVDGAGEARWESVGVRPVAGLYPMPAWQAGAWVSDYHELAIPAHLAPGVYLLQLALAPPLASAANDGGDASASWVDLATVTVEAGDALKPLPEAARALFGRALWLTGTDLPVQATVGAPVAVGLAWRAAQPAPGARIDLSWIDAAGEVAEASGPGERASARDAPRFQTRQVIDAPAAPGTYDLAAGWVDARGAALPARCRWLAPVAERCVLGSVAVIAPEGLANYANLLTLVSAEVGPASARAGDTIGATFRWRALKAIEQDYTEFVQLVGPDGRLHGQVDAWPVQGTRPTSEWAPGDEVVDRHAVRLDGDAPPGRYQVHVGWYLLETMERLPVLGADGHPVGDSLVVGEVEAEQ